MEELVNLLSLSDLHIYLTVPFVLSWSLFNALACGCTVLASDTPPVIEVITNGTNGLLADFFDVEGLAEKALAVFVIRRPIANSARRHRPRQRTLRTRCDPTQAHGLARGSRRREVANAALAQLS